MYEDAHNFLKGKKKWLYDTAQSARKGAKETPAKKARGGPGNRKKPRMRMADSGTKDSWEKIPGRSRASLRPLKALHPYRGSLISSYISFGRGQRSYETW